MNTTEQIDQMFVDLIVKAKREGTLQIENESPGGATLRFPMRTTKVEMHLGASNWAIVQEALKAV